jgi:hypothetical protein
MNGFTFLGGEFAESLRERVLGGLFRDRRRQYLLRRLVRDRRMFAGRDALQRLRQQIFGETHVLLGFGRIDHVAFVVGYLSGALRAIDLLPNSFGNRPVFTNSRLNSPSVPP